MTRWVEARWVAIRWVVTGRRPVSGLPAQQVVMKRLVAGRSASVRRPVVRDVVEVTR